MTSVSERFESYGGGYSLMKLLLIPSAVRIRANIDKNIFHSIRISHETDLSFLFQTFAMINVAGNL